MQPRACLDNSPVFPSLQPGSLFSIFCSNYTHNWLHAGNGKERKSKIWTISKMKEKILNKSKGQSVKVQRRYPATGTTRASVAFFWARRRTGCCFSSPPLFWDAEQRTAAATVNMRCRFNLGSNWKSPPVRVQSRSCWRLGRPSIDTQGRWDAEHGGKKWEILLKKIENGEPQWNQSGGNQVIFPQLLPSEDKSHRLGAEI